MRSNSAHQLCLIFQLENFLRSDLNLSTSYGRSTDSESLSGLFFVSFIWLGVKISLKSLLLCPPCPDGVEIAYVQTD